MAEDIKSPVFLNQFLKELCQIGLKEGESFKQDEILAEIETDKVVIEVTAQRMGLLKRLSFRGNNNKKL